MIPVVQDAPVINPLLPFPLPSYAVSPDPSLNPQYPTGPDAAWATLSEQIIVALQGFSWVAPTGCVPDSVPDSII